MESAPVTGVDSDVDLRATARAMPYPQALMALSAIAAIAAIAIADPTRIDVGVVVSAAVLLAGAVAMIVVWHHRPAAASLWLAVVPLVSILACLPIRAAGTPSVPAAGLMVIFPISWLAFAFPVPLLAVGLVATALLPAYAVLPQGGLPDSPQEWAAVSALPTMLTLFAIAVSYVARAMDSQRRRAGRTDRRLAAALGASVQTETTLQAIMDTTPDAVALFDADGVVVSENAVSSALAARAGQAITNVEEISQRHIYEADRATPFEASKLAEAARRGELPRPRQIWVGPPGDQAAVEVVVRAIRSGGELRGFVFIAHDVTALVEAISVRDAFLDTVGHELRTPLTVIAGHADLALADDDASTAALARWRAVERAAERLGDTVEGLLLAGQRTRDQSDGDTAVVSTIRAGIDKIADRAARARVGLHVTGDRALRARAAPKDVARILAELLGNAVDASAPGDRVDVTVVRAGDRIAVTVDDSGVGMSADERRQAFDRFYRTPSAVQRAVQGSGLGLSIAKALAEANDADLVLEPHGVRGTRALLLLRAR